MRGAARSVRHLVPDSLHVALDALTRTRLYGLGLAVSAVAVPLALLVLLAWWRPSGGRTLRAVQRTAGSLVALVYAVHGASLATEWERTAVAPARGRVARALGEPVVTALARYREEHGQFPHRLAELVPRYLSAEVLSAPERSPLAHPFEYDGPRSDGLSGGSSYVLRVREAPPGHSACDFASRTQRWYCSGYF